MVFRRPYWWRLLGALLFLGATVPASAHREIREWRSLGQSVGVAVNGQDGSVWAAIGSFVYHLADDGTVLSRVRFVPDLGRAGYPASLAVSPADGSCWAFGHDAGVGGVLVRYAADGSEIWRQSGLGDPGVDLTFRYTPSLGVYPADGSCWVAARDDYSNRLWHLSASGQVLYSSGGEAWASVGPIAVNPTDGSCWAAIQPRTEPSYLLHLAADGTELWRGLGALYGFGAVGVNPADGSVWVCDWTDIVHLDADGHEIWHRQDTWSALAISANPLDGSAWLASQVGVVHLAENGSILWDGDPGREARDVSVDPRDGSAWATRLNGADRVVHYAADGTVLWRMTGDYSPGQISANRADGSCWVVDQTWFGLPSETTGGLAHVSAAGRTLWHSAPFPSTVYPTVVATDPRDGSVWLAEDVGQTTAPYTVTSRVRHFSAAGTELWRDDIAEFPNTSAWILTAGLDDSDGSLWVSLAHEIASTSQFLRYDADGTLAWRTSYPGVIMSLSAAAGDGSCWLADPAGTAVRRVGRDGTVLASAYFAGPMTVAADSADGSCWAAGGPVGFGCQVVHFAADGSERWRSPTSDAYPHLAVDPTTGFCWVADRTDLFVYSPTGLELWRGEVAPLEISIDSGDSSCWFSATGDGWYIGRELVHLQVPLTPFGDVTYANWARDEINACAEAGIVQGYPSGAHAIYRPDQEVTRAQMAAYVARAFAGGEDAVPEPVGEPTFSDVDAGYWAYRYIEYCAQQDLVEGYPGGRYQPGWVVTRAQMAVFIARALAGGDALVPTGPEEAVFPDVGTDHWAYDYISYCQAEGIVDGYPDGSYQPDRRLTRDQMAVFIARAFDLSLEWPSEG